MTTITQLQEKLEAATIKVEKAHATIERHIKGVEKKVATLTKKGVDFTNIHDYTDLDALKYDVVDGVTVASKYLDEHFEAFYKLSSQAKNIDGAKKKLVEVERIRDSWHDKLILALEKKSVVENKVPQVIIDFMNEWKLKVKGWVLDKVAEMPAHKAELISIGMNYIEIQKEMREFAGTLAIRVSEIRNLNARNEWLDNYLDKEAERKVIVLLERLESITGDVVDAGGLRIMNGEINGFVVGVKGTAEIQTIGAGGHHIQCFHYRTLIKEIK